MTLSRGLLAALVAVILLASAGAWYLFGPNGVSGAKLVPGDTLAFALIPKGAGLGASYTTSQLKKLADAPEAQPVFDKIQQLIGDKNLGLLKILLPDLSGQSFIAITHFDPAHPSDIGFIAGMRPKLGADNFDTFVQQVNAAYPDMAKETKTGRDTLLGLDYQWIQGANAPGRICVARFRGWVLTAWGEASLQDCLERLQGKPTSPSLAENADYQKSLTRVGPESQALLYIDYPRVVGLWANQMAGTNPGLADSLKKRVANIGAAAVGTSFVNGEIVDHFSVLEPKQAQLDSGVSPAPCAFDTLKFTGPDTRLYFGASVNWPQVWKNMQEQTNAGQPGLRSIFDRLQGWAQSENIDVEKNIIDALGPEYSFQIEWASDSLYPSVGVYFKVDKPDDFKPTIAALIDSTRKEFATTAVINEMNSGGQNFATLKLIRPMPFSPTITEDGPYFGFFLDETHAVRSMARDAGQGLAANADFTRQIGGQRDGANELVFFDAPKLLDQAYRTALPYVSMGALINPTLASVLQNHQLPPDLAWLAPMGTWSALGKSDDDGLTGFSISGVGNQGILLAGGIGASAMALQSAGILPQSRYTSPVPGNPIAPAPAPLPATPIAAPVPAPAPATPPAPASNATPATPPPPADSTH
jgi:hypothetical protein